MGALGTTAVFERVKPLEPASFTPQMEDSQSSARDSSPASLGWGYLANSLVQLLETATHELERDCEVAKAALVTASTLLQAEGWHRGRCCACAPLSIAIYTVPFTIGISAQLRSVARLTSVENSNSPLA